VFLIAFILQFSLNQVEALLSAYDEAFLPNHTAFFLGKKVGDSFSLAPLKEFDAFSNGADDVGLISLLCTPCIHHFQIYLCVCDPCNLDDHPGWPVRIFLTLAAFHWFVESRSQLLFTKFIFRSEKLGGVANILCLRDRFKDGVRCVRHSLVFTVDLPSIAGQTGVRL
jgi:ubiquitin-like modifier-activating enzyme ATG7